MRVLRDGGGQAAVPEGPEGQAAVPEGPEGQAAVPEGGGRARAGLEIDHSEPSGSRVAISRAGRRPPAHTAARPIKATHAGGRRSGRPSGRPEIRRGTATPEIRRVHNRHPHNGQKETPTAPGTP